MYFRMPLSYPFLSVPILSCPVRSKGEGDEKREGEERKKEEKREGEEKGNKKPNGFLPRAPIFSLTGYSKAQSPQDGEWYSSGHILHAWP